MKKIIEYFKSNYTKWHPLGSYSYAQIDHITFIRKNLKTGMMQFKTKRVNKNSAYNTNAYSILPNGIIDTSKIWENIVNI